jgi:UDP-galactopyranose mutase
MRRTCLVVGAGLAGAAAAWALARRGFHVVVFEGAAVVGGHVRTEWFQGIPYEPHGAHIFHTPDAAVWRLVTSLVPFEPYRHRVLTRMRGRLWSWPLQLSELRGLDEWPDIERELATRPPVPDHSDFESYCVTMMGETLYRLYIRDYTRKQWARDPDTLASSIAFRRVELRDDGHQEIFRDPNQGWPTGGYAPLVEAMLGAAEVNLGSTLRFKDLPSLARPGDPVIVTSALDDFFGAELGALEWRGVRLTSRAEPGVALAQAAMVVNEPDPMVPWTRTIETKWALPQLHRQLGTIVMREFPDSRAKHYPVADRAGVNATLQSRYERRAASLARNPLVCAGRLATYRYINMDEAIRQGLNAAHRVLHM